MRIIVTGSRDFTFRPAVWNALDKLHVPENGLLTLVHGACPTGADHYAQDWADTREGYGSAITVVRFWPDWRKYSAKAGPIRNTEMIAAGGDLLLAFYAPPPALNKGTRGCVKLAKAAGIPVREYGLETRATVEHEQEALFP